MSGSCEPSHTDSWTDLAKESHIFLHELPPSRKNSMTRADGGQWVYEVNNWNGNKGEFCGQSKQ